MEIAGTERSARKPINKSCNVLAARLLFSDLLLGAQCGVLVDICPANQAINSVQGDTPGLY
jgi:hypothetical protein